MARDVQFGSPIMKAIHIAGVLGFASMFVVGCSANTEDDSESAGQNLVQTITRVTPDIEAFCKGGKWYSTPSFASLDGTFARTSSPVVGSLSSVTFAPSTTNGTWVNGTYSATVEGGAPLSGAFAALPDNRAFETSIHFENGATKGPIYFVVASRHDTVGNLTALCAIRMVDAASPEPVIVLTRVAP